MNPQFPDLPIASGLLHASDLLAYFASDPVCYSSYLLFLQEQLHSGEEGPQSYILFILWLITQGRHHSLHPLVVPDSVIDDVTQPTERGQHALMVYSVSIFGPKHGDGWVQDDELVRAIYYFEIVPKMGLAPFLGKAELRYLAEREQRDCSPMGLSDLAELYSRKYRQAFDGAQLKEVQELVGTLAASAEKQQRLPKVSIVGFHRSVLGLGEDARCLFECLLHAGIGAELVDVSPPALERFDRPDRYCAFEAKRPTGKIVIFCMPPFEMMRTIATLGLQKGNEYRIGYWPWETTELPKNWSHVFDFVDEVWASSAFLEKCFSAQTNKCVTYMPPYIDVEQPQLRHDLSGLFAGRFTFVSIFDFNSRIERKNPVGAIEAFLSAFPEGDEDVNLIFKTLHQDTNAVHFNSIQDAMAGDQRIIMIDGALSKAEVCGLVSASDAYISLHRSEGFGRPLAEAMLLGIPVIATQWSGSSDFLNSRTGYPIKSRLRPVQAHEYPFAAGKWAEPDTEQAARIMRSLYEHRDDQKEVTSAASRLVRKQYSQLVVSRRLRERLNAIALTLESRIK